MDVRTTTLGDLVQQNYIDDEAWTRKGALVDDCAKKIVSNRMICAKILKAAIPEFKDCTEDEIAFYYLGDEFEISTRAVHMENADVPEDMFINEMNSEARGEKYSHDKIYFDIRFSALAPVKGKLVKLLFDIEIQNEFYPGYSLEKRAVYYASRMVSEQHGREFIGSDYNRIKKVYSIWLNTNPPKKYRHSIGYYNYSFTLAENSFDVKPDDYMLSNIVMINLGGNVQTLGTKPDGSLWNVALKNPIDTEKEVCVVSLSDKAMITSGGYERYFIGKDGKQYWHILDPKTGYPSDKGLLSVTIIGKDGTLCDALSTALFVMGEEKAKAFVKTQSKTDVILINRDMEIFITENLKDHIKMLDNFRYQIIA